MFLRSSSQDHCGDKFCLWSYSFTEPNNAERAIFNTKKLLNLGWNYRPLEETIVDSIKNYEEAGLLNTDGISLNIKF